MMKRANIKNIANQKIQRRLCLTWARYSPEIFELGDANPTNIGNNMTNSCFYNIKSLHDTDQRCVSNVFPLNSPLGVNFLAISGTVGTVAKTTITILTS